MLVSAGFTALALNYTKSEKSSYTLKTLIHACREENCILLGYYMSSGISLLRIREIGPKTLARNYHYSLQNNLEEHGSQLPHHESLKSCTDICNYLIYIADKQYKISVTNVKTFQSNRLIYDAYSQMYTNK
jgi:hypothetical protein